MAWLALAFAASKVAGLDNRLAGAAAALCLAAALPAAIVLAEPTRLSTHEIFPQRLVMNGDTLTRTAASDRRGCAAVLTDDTLLEPGECLLTVTVTYTTDDSDAVATLSAVLSDVVSHALLALTYALAPRQTGAVARVGSGFESLAAHFTASDLGKCSSKDQPLDTG